MWIEFFTVVGTIPDPTLPTGSGNNYPQPDGPSTVTVIEECECSTTFTMTPLSRPQIIVLLLLLAGIYIFTPRGFLSNPSTDAIDIEIVLSFYREDVLLVSEQIKLLREILAQNGWTSRVIVYSKDESISFDQTELLQRKLGADSLRSLPNKGREGGTL